MTSDSTHTDWDTNPPKCLKCGRPLFEATDPPDMYDFGFQPEPPRTERLVGALVNCRHCGARHSVMGEYDQMVDMSATSWRAQLLDDNR